MNQPSEQLTAEYNIVMDYDQPLTRKKMQETILHKLGDSCKVEMVEGRNVLVYQGLNKPIIILCKAITYLGNPHPLFKKRIQIPKDWITYTKRVLKLGYDVRFIGVYHYKGLVVFADFEKESYLSHNCNNSAAHVYINDIFQGLTNDVFHKIDRNYNSVYTISQYFFRSYLDGYRSSNHLLELFSEFNKGFEFGKWLKAIEAIKEMQTNDWSQWRQAEWSGWYLEYKFNLFTQLPQVAGVIIYTGLSNKSKRMSDFDFDIFFPLSQFYGDLKASDIDQKKSPGNDQQTFIRCINKYNRFWYVIFEHETIKDSEREYEATKARNLFLKQIDNVPDNDFDLMSYHKRMKNSVRFVNMYIIELNRINFHNILSDFNQGHQPDGGKRKPKFLIGKKDIDNFVIYRYRFDNDTK